MTPTTAEIRVLVSALQHLYDLTFCEGPRLWVLQEIAQDLSVFMDGLRDKSEWVASTLGQLEWMTFPGVCSVAVGQLVMLRTNIKDMLNVWDLILLVRGLS